MAAVLAPLALGPVLGAPPALYGPGPGPAPAGAGPAPAHAGLAVVEPEVGRVTAMLLAAPCNMTAEAVERLFKVLGSPAAVEWAGLALRDYFTFFLGVDPGEKLDSSAVANLTVRMPTVAYTAILLAAGIGVGERRAAGNNIVPLTPGFWEPIAGGLGPIGPMQANQVPMRMDDPQWEEQAIMDYGQLDPMYAVRRRVLVESLQLARPPTGVPVYGVTPMEARNAAMTLLNRWERVGRELEASKVERHPVADGTAHNSELVSSMKRLADSTSAGVVKKMSMEHHGDVLAYLRSEGLTLQHRSCVVLTQQAVFNDFLQKLSAAGNQVGTLPYSSNVRIAKLKVMHHPGTGYAVDRVTNLAEPEDQLKSTMTSEDVLRQMDLWCNAVLIGLLKPDGRGNIETFMNISADVKVFEPLVKRARDIGGQYALSGPAMLEVVEVTVEAMREHLTGARDQTVDIIAVVQDAIGVLEASTRVSKLAAVMRGSGSGPGGGNAVSELALLKKQMATLQGQARGQKRKHDDRRGGGGVVGIGGGGGGGGGGGNGGGKKQAVGKALRLDDGVVGAVPCNRSEAQCGEGRACMFSHEHKPYYIAKTQQWRDDHKAACEKAGV